MHHRKLKIESLMQSSILFYDDSHKEVCSQICKQLCIDILPDLDGKHYYKICAGSFQKHLIHDNMKLSVYDDIFNESLVKAFISNPGKVLFVFDGALLAGVVHITDYNKDIFLQALQDDILAFERKLRKLLLLNGLGANDVVKFHEVSLMYEPNNRWHGGQLVRIKKELPKRSEIDIFNILEFSQLISFAKSAEANNSFVMDEDGHKNQVIICKLRNRAMHSDNFIGINHEAEDLHEIYRTSDFIELVNDLKIFLDQMNKLNNELHLHPSFQNSLKMDNSARLNNIAQGYPEALNFYIGF